MIIKKELKNKIIMGIDPSINNCGIAIFKNGLPVFYDLFHPKKIKGQSIVTTQKLKKRKESLDYIDKSISLRDQIKIVIKKYKVTHLIIEVPEYFGYSGYMARESGAVHKLTFICGVLVGIENVIVVPINPSSYRFQMPKPVIQNRMQLHMPKLDIFSIDHNVVDALSLCWWYTFGKI